MLSIVNCILKFQNDILKKPFLLRIDCKAAKDFLQKDVKNLGTKHIFARWQALLVIFDFEIEFIKRCAVVVRSKVENGQFSVNQALLFWASMQVKLLTILG